MKYLEELKHGDCLKYNNEYYIATCDFDKFNKRLCISFKSGHPRWLPLNSPIDHIQIYILDADNNFIGINHDQ